MFNLTQLEILYDTTQKRIVFEKKRDSWKAGYRIRAKKISMTP